MGYYGPAWVQRAGSLHSLDTLRILATVYRLARSLWPVSEDWCTGTVIIQCGILKELDIVKALQMHATDRFFIQRHSATEGKLEVSSLVANNVNMSDPCAETWLETPKCPSSTYAPFNFSL